MTGIFKTHYNFSFSIYNCYRAAVVAQCDVVWSLMRSFSSGQEPISSLPPKVQRILMFSLLFCDVGERKQQFLTEVGDLEFVGFYSFILFCWFL